MQYNNTEISLLSTGENSSNFRTNYRIQKCGNSNELHKKKSEKCIEIWEQKQNLTLRMNRSNSSKFSPHSNWENSSNFRNAGNFREIAWRQIGEMHWNLRTRINLIYIYLQTWKTIKPAICTWFNLVRIRLTFSSSVETAFTDSGAEERECWILWQWRLEEAEGREETEDCNGVENQRGLEWEREDNGEVEV